MADFDWQSFIFDSQGQWMDRLLARARQRFHADETFAEEAHTYAFEKLSENDWGRLRDYRNGAQPGTYLFAVYNRLLEDANRNRFGRQRPPTWLSSLGATWVRVWELLCRSRFEPETVVDWLCASEVREPEAIRDMMRVIKGRIPGCGKLSGEQSVAELPEPQAGDRPASLSPEPDADHLQMEEILLALATLLSGAAPRPVRRERVTALARDVSDASDALGEEMGISDEERLLLRLHYEEGHAVARVARELGRPEHQVRRELKAIVGRIVKALEARGIDREALAGLLED